MATDKQMEANRRNAALSTGPRTDAGKHASRANALKHGLTADALIVLADEDPAQLEDRVGAFFRAIGPRDEFEEHEVTRLASLSWKADRADRHEAAATERRVRDRIQADLAALRERVRGLFPRLLPGAEAVEESGFDAVPPVDLVAMIEATAEGCRYLLGRWEMLRKAVERRGPWTPFEEMSIVRLSGFEMDWVRDSRPLDLLVAGRVLRDPSAGPDPDAFAAGPYNLAVDRKAMREACARRPTTVDEASEVLIGAIDAAAGRLEGLLTRRERDGDAVDVEESASLALFDPSMEGERLRRYQVATSREMDRILRSIERGRDKVLKERIDEMKLATLRHKADELGVDWPEPPDLRNEPNSAAEEAEDPDYADGEAVEEAASDAPEPAVLRNEANSAPVAPRNKANFDLDEFDKVEWVDLPSML